MLRLKFVGEQGEYVKARRFGSLVVDSLTEPVGDWVPQQAFYHPRYRARKGQVRLQATLVADQGVSRGSCSCSSCGVSVV
jgi:hypothetical protein